jgi:hypothetical protein
MWTLAADTETLEVCKIFTDSPVEVLRKARNLKDISVSELNDAYFIALISAMELCTSYNNIINAHSY